MSIKSKVLSLVIALVSCASFGRTLYVTETNEFGSESLPVTIANAQSGDTIRFKLNSAFITIDFPITIDRDLVIIGATAGSMTISPSNAIDRLFNIQDGITVYLKDLHIDNYRNGAISLKTGSSVTLERCQVQSCIGFSGQLGGAFYNSGGDLTLLSTTVRNCSADAGAGIYNADGGRLNIVNSSILDNTANNIGGGIYQTGNGSSTSIRNSTVNGNYADTEGHGIYLAEGSCNLYNSLISFNGEDGGEIFGVINSNGYNLILNEDGIDGASNWPTSTDLGGVDPLINNVGAEGGATYTAKPASNSPIIDAGDPNFSGLEFDNRLAYRVMDGDRNGNARIDIGALEYSDFNVTDLSGSALTTNSLPNILAQIDTTLAEGPYYVDFDFFTTASIVPLQRMTIKRKILIDGFSFDNTYPPGAWQPGQFRLELRGSTITANEPMFDFQAGSEGSEIRGVSMFLTSNGTLSTAINISADDIKVGGNLIGLSSNGAQSFNQIGVYIDGARDVTIGGSEERDRNVFNNSGQNIYITNNSANSGIDIKGNWIGTNISGTAANGTGAGTGVLVEGGNNIIIGGSTYVERNVISNNQTGITIDAIGQREVDIIGNYIGTNKDGTIAIFNQNYGVSLVNAEGINVGGEDDNETNIISGNISAGILLDGLNTTKNRVFNNYIGTDETGLFSINNGFGVQISNGANFNEIGIAGYKNIISGNGNRGLSSNQSDNNLIIGNYIGLDATGGKSLANNGDGISFFDCSNNIIGSTDIGGSNYISGNTSGGNAISIYSSSGSISNVIINNYIGVEIDGTSSLPNNGSGVFLDNNVDSTIIGGQGDSSNVIANSLFGSGIIFSEMSGGNPEKNKVHNNKIYNNAFNGISFFGNVQEGVEIAYITSLETDSTLNGTSSPNAYIQIFADSLNQGEILLGTTTADASGNWTRNLTIPELPWTTGYLTVLQDSANNTSTFGENVELCFAPLHVVKTADDSSCGTLRKALIYASEMPGPHTITFGISNDTISAEIGYDIICDSSIIIDGTGKNLTVQPRGSYWDNVTAPASDLFTISATNTTIKGLNLYGKVDQQPILKLQSGVFNVTNDNLTVDAMDISGFTTYGIANIGSNLVVTNSTLLDFGQYGIVSVTGADAKVQSCNIGFREGEAPITGDQYIGIVGTSNFQIGGDINSEGNTIAYCDSVGIYLIGPNSIIEGNLIGINNQEEEAGNKHQGIYLSGADSTKIGDGTSSKRNVIAGNGMTGITVDQCNVVDINFNYFGSGSDGDEPIYNQLNGIKFINGSSDNLISNNWIMNQDSAGIVVDGANTDSNYFHNNLIFDNLIRGVILMNGGNGSIGLPTIDTIISSTISGTALPNSYVEIYGDQFDQGSYILDTVHVGATGNWSYTINGDQMQILKLNRLDTINVIQTTWLQGSSEFSNSKYIQHVGDPLKVEVHNAMSLNGDGKNEEFIIDYLKQPEYDDNELVILNKWGIEIYRAKNYQNQEPWDGTWKGQNVPDGTYYYMLTTKFKFQGENKEYFENGFIEIRSFGNQ